jgi:hypothetical protein
MGLENYLTGTANLDGTDDEFDRRVLAMIQALPPSLANQVKVFSAYRDIEHQRRLWDAKVAEVGEQRARKWVAPPGKSNHNHGVAIDLRYGSDAARQWVHANAKQFGLGFPMGHEPWHIEPLGVRSGEYKGKTIDPEAYTDGLGLTPADNHSAETQMLRFAKMLEGGVGATVSRFREGTDADIVEAVNRNTEMDDGGR